MFNWNAEKHTYEITSNDLVERAINNINTIAKRDLVIINDADLKRAREMRTEINNAVKEVSTIRKQMTAIVLSQFAPQCLEVEKYGAMVSNELTEKINEYIGKDKEVTYEVVIKSTDKKAISKVIEVATKYGCTVKEK